MFDWLFKRSSSERNEIRQLGNKINNLEVKLNKKHDSMKSTCLDNDKKMLEPLQQHIAELEEKRDNLRLNQYHKSVDELNSFPLHTPCSLSHISDVLDIDYDSLHRVMYLRKVHAHRFRSHRIEYVLKLDNWREVRYDRITYLEKIR